MYHFVSMHSILTLVLPAQYPKIVLRTILAKNIVKIIVTIPLFAIKNNIFANEQKCYVGKLRSWIIVTNFS